MTRSGALQPKLQQGVFSGEMGQQYDQPQSLPNAQRGGSAYNAPAQHRHKEQIQPQVDRDHNGGRRRRQLRRAVCTHA